MSLTTLTPSPPSIVDFTYKLTDATDLIKSRKITAQVNTSLADCFSTTFNLTTTQFVDRMEGIGQASKSDNLNYATVIITSNTTPRVFLGLGQLKWRDPNHDNKSTIVNLCVNPDHRSGAWGQTVVSWLEYIGRQAGVAHLYLQPENTGLIKYYKGLKYAESTGGLMVKQL